MAENKELDLQLKDNFLNEEEFKIIWSNLNRISFNFRDKGENVTDGFRHFFTPDDTNKWLFEKIKKNFFPRKKLNPKVCAYHLRWNKKEKMIHRDDDMDYNFILYLKGKEILYNGTGFFDDKQLNALVGFKHNRALFFNGRDVLHSDLQAFGESSFRYTVNIFYKYNG